MLDPDTKLVLSEQKFELEAGVAGDAPGEDARVSACTLVAAPARCSLPALTGPRGAVALGRL